jgi:WD40 repeat protein
MGEDAPLPDSMVLGPRGAAWSADSRRILHWTDDGVLHIWDAETGGSLAAMPHDDRLIGAVWNADDTRVMSWALDGTLRVWDAAGGRAVFAPVLVGTDTAVGIAPRDFAQSAVWNAGETRILVATGAGSVEIYDSETGEALTRFARRNGRVLGAVWSLDETRVLSWSDDGSAEVGDAATGAAITRVMHTASVQGAAWSADGARIMTWGWDNTVRIWDAVTGAALLRLDHPNWVMTAAWNADETRLLTWANFEAARIWDVTLPGMMAAAQAELGL